MSGARELLIAAAQTESANGDIRGNLEHATGFAEEAAERGAKLVVFPEFMPTGYIFTKVIWDAAEARDGPTATWLAENSRRLGIWLGTCFLEAEGDEFYNTFMLTNPAGEIAGTVRKQTPAAVEAYFFRGKAGDHIIETDLGRIGVGICYENQLAFLGRLMYSHSVDLMLMPHSAPAPTPGPLMPRSMREAYAQVLRDVPIQYARALGVPVLFINKCGPFQSPVPGMPFYRQDSYFPGESAVVDSDGKLLERLGLDEGVAVAKVILDPSRKSAAPPPSRGRWSMKVPWAINAFRLAETAGHAWYSASRDRRRAACSVSSGSYNPGPVGHIGPGPESHNHSGI